MAVGAVFWGLGMLTGVVAYMILRVRAIRPTKIVADDVTMIGVSELFAEELEELRREPDWGSKPGAANWSSAYVDEPLRGTGPHVFLDRRDAAEGRLPPVCMRCGEPATVWVRRTFAVTRTLRATNRTETEFPVVRTMFCERHRHTWRRRRLLRLLLFLTGVVATFGLCVAPLVIAELPGRGIFFWAWLGAIVVLTNADRYVRTSGIVARKATDRGLVLEGISPRFVAAVARWTAFDDDSANRVEPRSALPEDRIQP